MTYPKSLLEQGRLDETLTRLYGRSALASARNRCAQLLEAFSQAFGTEASALFSAPGRTEVGGNHTDHQHGRVLAAAVDLDILAAAAPNDSGVIRVQSQGYAPIIVDLGELTPRPEEVNTSAALIRGVAARMAELGCSLEGRGLDVCMTSTVPGGSGLSSSAAFEVLMGTMLNDLFAGGTHTPVEIAQIGQYAENVFFGKPCGLMDQTASAVGGAVSIDFQDPAAPVVRRVDFDFSAAGHALCIIDSGADHADLTAEYAAIPGEMKAVAAALGKTVLREVDEAEFRAHIPALRKKLGDRAILRAMHFFAEDRRAAEEAEALEQGDFDRFLALVRASGLSSALRLENTWAAADPRQQAIPVVLAQAEELLGGRGAVRVHGGGFAGTVQAFVPNDLLPSFRLGMEALLGPGMCHVLSIRPEGGCTVIG